ncbi:hypothetical protein Tco_0222704 [Tanacetum coccineum]
MYKVGLSAKVISSKDEDLGEEDASKQGSKIPDIDAEKDITLENVHDVDMFGVHDLDGDEVFVETKESVVNVAVVNADTTTTKLKTAKPKAVTIAVTTTTTSVTRPKAKGLVIQEQEQASTPTPIVFPQQLMVKDKGKGIMVEDPLKMKKKDQISYDQ